MCLNKSTFLEVLSQLDEKQWTAWVEPRGPIEGCIHLKRVGSEMLFSPITAAYYQLTQEEIHRGSFWCEELQTLGIPWWYVVEIAYANIKCGTAYNKRLRNDILRSLRLPEEKI